MEGKSTMITMTPIQTQKRRDTLLSFVTFKCSHSHNHRLNSTQV